VHLHADSSDSPLRVDTDTDFGIVWGVDTAAGIVVVGVG